MNLATPIGRPLTRGRGLKHMHPEAYRQLKRSPPHAGAWIETP